MRSIVRPKEIIADSKYEKLEMKDVFIMLGSALFGYITSYIVFSYLQVLYICAYPVALYFLLSPSKEVPKKKNYQVAMQVLFKDRRVYHPISTSKVKEEE